jgi:hypothetical protein
VRFDLARQIEFAQVSTTYAHELADAVGLNCARGIGQGTIVDVETEPMAAVPSCRRAQNCGVAAPEINDVASAS